MIGVDWATTSLRAFRFADDGSILDRIDVATGIRDVPPGGFPAALWDVAGPWIADGETRVLLSGMVGSRQGWWEAPYVRCPAALQDISEALVPIPFAQAAVRLVPGLSDLDAAAVPELMRGQETALVGVMELLGSRALVCLPGLHSQWVRVDSGLVTAFRTHLSGDVLAALRERTILGTTMTDGPHDDAAFLEGVARSGDGEGILHHFFGVRALSIVGMLAETSAPSYLLGLVIGHEVRSAAPRDQVVHLVGESTLTQLYADVLTQLGATAIVLPPDAAARGLARIGARADWG